MIEKGTNTAWNISTFTLTYIFKSWKKDSSNKVYVKTKHKREAEPATLLKERLRHRCFPMNLAKFLKAPFFSEHHR